MGDEAERSLFDLHDFSLPHLTFPSLGSAHLIAVICVLGCGIGLNYYLTKLWTSTWVNLGLQSPPCYSVFGNSLQIKARGSIRASVKDWYNIYGNTFGFHIGLQPVLVVADGALAEAILQTSEEYFCGGYKAPACIHKELDDKCLFLSHGSQWDSLRYIMTTVFSSDNLTYMMNRITRCATTLSEYFEDISNDEIENHKRYNISELISAYSYDTVAALVIGEELDYYKDSSHPFFETMSKCMKEAKSDPVGVVLPNKMRDMRKYFDKVIEERKRGSHKEGMIDFIDIFNHAGDASNLSPTITLQFPIYAMTHTEKVGSLIHWMLHGHEAVVSTLQFVLHLLAKNPDHMQVMQAEIEKKVSTDQPTYEELQELQFMDLVIKETLRIYSPVQEIWRYTSDAIETDNMVIPAHCAILIPVNLIHSDPAGFRHANKFQPERYVSHDKGATSGSFLAFGSGPRSCIGKELSVLIIKSALVHVLRKVKIMRIDKEVPYSSSFFEVQCGMAVAVDGILRPYNSLRLKMEPRRPQDVFKLRPADIMSDQKQVGATEAEAEAKERDMLRDKMDSHVKFPRSPVPDGGESSSAAGYSDVDMAISSPNQNVSLQASQSGVSADTTASSSSTSSAVREVVSSDMLPDSEADSYNQSKRPSLDEELWNERMKNKEAKTKGPDEPITSPSGERFFDAVEQGEQGNVTAPGEELPSISIESPSETSRQKVEVEPESSAAEPSPPPPPPPLPNEPSEKPPASPESSKEQEGEAAANEEEGKKKHKEEKKEDEQGEKSPTTSGADVAPGGAEGEEAGEGGEKKHKKKKKKDNDMSPTTSGADVVPEGAGEESGDGREKKHKKKKKKDKDGEKSPSTSGLHVAPGGAEEEESGDGGEKKHKKKKKKDKDGEKSPSTSGLHVAPGGAEEEESGDGGEKKHKKKKKKDKDGEKSPSTSGLHVAPGGAEEEESGDGGEKKHKKKKKKDKDGEKSPSTSGLHVAPGGAEGEESGDEHKKKKEKDGEKSPSTSGLHVAPGGAEGEESGDEHKKKKEKDGEKSPSTSGLHVAPGGAEGEESGDEHKKKKEKDGEKSPATSGADVAPGGAEGEESGDGGEKKHKKKKKKDKDGEKSPTTSGADVVPEGAGEDLGGGEKKHKKKKKKDKDGEKSPTTSGADVAPGGAEGEESGEGGEKKHKKKKKKDKDGEKSPATSGAEVVSGGEESEKKPKKKKKKDKDGEKSPATSGAEVVSEGEESEKKP